MKRWRVESGKVKEGDLLKRIVKTEIIVDKDLAQELSKYTVSQLDSIGIKIFRETKIFRDIKKKGL